MTHGDTDSESTTTRFGPRWVPFSRPREISAFIFGIAIAGIVVLTGRTELVVPFVLIALGAKADDIHLPRVQREPVYALIGYVCTHAGYELWGLRGLLGG